MKSEQLKKSIEAIISGTGTNSTLANFLSIISKCYDLAMALRLKLYRNNFFKTHRLPCKVISIGNITLGGTGKTPMTVYMAELIKNMGFKPAIVCRGYKGEYEHSVKTVTDGGRIFTSPEQSGDEPYLMATKLSGIPIVVGKNRYVSGMKAYKLFRPDIIILDDAFQHIRLFRDLNLLLLDAANPFGNGQIFPRGILRESLDQMDRADAIVITRYGRNYSENKVFPENKKGYAKPLFRCRHVPDAVSFLTSDGSWRPSRITDIRGEKGLAFAGIAKNEDFLTMLNNLGFQISEFIRFPDHHKFSDQDVDKILNRAEKTQAKFIITTEKDRVKLPINRFLAMNLYSLGVKISFIDRDRKRFHDFIFRAIASI